MTKAANTHNDSKGKDTKDNTKSVNQTPEKNQGITPKKETKTESQSSNKLNKPNADTDPANINVKGLEVNPAPASQSINGMPVSNQYADNIGLPDPGAVIPANNPTKHNVKDVQVREADVDHSKDKPVSYKESAEAAALVEGDTVRVTRRPLPAELELWGGTWSEGLDQTIGRKYTLGADHGAKGFTIDIGNGITYLVPVYCIEKVVG